MSSPSLKDILKIVKMPASNLREKVLKEEASMKILALFESNSASKSNELGKRAAEKGVSSVKGAKSNEPYEYELYDTNREFRDNRRKNQKKVYGIETICIDCGKQHNWNKKK